MFHTAVVVFALATPMADMPDASRPVGVDRITQESQTKTNIAEPVEKTTTKTSPPESSAETKSAAKSKSKPKRIPKIYLSTRAEKDVYKAKYQKLARESFSSKKPNPGNVVPRLVNMYNELHMVHGLQKSEIARMRKTLELRMLSLIERLNRDIAKTRRFKNSATRRLTSRVVPSATYKTEPSTAAKTQPRVSNQVAAASKPPAPLAATEQQNARALINLIEQTIAPDTWESRGGGGSIFYYAPRHALVIRQTDDVHRQIGGVLGNLNK